MHLIKLYFKALIGGLLIAVYIPFLYLAKDKNKRPRTALSKLLLKVFMVKPQIYGSFDDEAGIFIINHQSVLDIVVIEAITSRDLCWIAKEELFRLPLFGHLFKSCKMIAVDRENKQGLVKLLKDSKEAQDLGRPLVIFPEGTRSKESELLEFKPGAKMIAEKLDLKVQPIVIVDSASFFDTKFPIKKGIGSSGGTLKIVYLDSFLPQKKSEWLKEARDKMQIALNEKRAEG